MRCTLWCSEVNTLVDSTTNVNEVILQLLYILYVYYIYMLVYYVEKSTGIYYIYIYSYITLLSTYYYYNSETLRYTDSIIKRITISRLFSVKWETRVLINLLQYRLHDVKINKQSTIIKKQKNTIENLWWYRNKKKYNTNTDKITADCPIYTIYLTYVCNTHHIYYNGHRPWASSWHHTTTTFPQVFHVCILFGRLKRNFFTRNITRQFRVS
jgi:hypothetical protein